MDPLQKRYYLLAHSVAEQARKIDCMKTDRALRDQELHHLRSSHASHVEELELLRAERNLLVRDRQAQLAHVVDFVIGLPLSVELAYDKRRREQQVVDPVPPPNKRPRISTTPSSPPGDLSTVARPADHATQRRSASDSSKRPRVAAPPNSPPGALSTVARPADPVT